MRHQLKRPKPLKLQQCNLNVVKSSFSEPRMAKYLNAVPKNDKQVENAMRLYQINMLYCEALYPSLHSLEIALRNSIDSSLSQHYNNKYWFIPNKSFFDRDSIKQFIQYNTSSLIFPDAIKGILLNKENEQVFKAIKELIRLENKKKSNYQEHTVSFSIIKARENIISKLTLGFWIALITQNKVKNGHYLHKVFIPSIKAIFPYALKKERSRDKIYELLTSIRNLRNRVFHHEPVWGYKDIEQRYNNIITVINWIDPNIKLWLHSSESIDRFPQVYKQYCEEVIQLTKFKKSHLKKNINIIIK